jgi:hypothetical protein
MTSHRSKYFTLTVLFTAHTCCYLSQNDNSRNLDEKYTPNDNSIFNVFARPGSRSSYLNTSYQNYITFCPTLMARQKIVFAFEHCLNNRIRINAGIGRSFGTDLIRRAGLNYTESYSLSFSDNLSEADIMQYGSFSKGGFILAGGIKFIIKSPDENTSIYLSLNYRHDRLNYVLPATISIYDVIGDNSAKINLNVLSGGMGYILTNTVQKRFTHEIFVLANCTVSSFTNFQLQTGSLQNKNTYKMNDQNPLITKPSFGVSFGYALGFGF